MSCVVGPARNGERRLSIFCLDRGAGPEMFSAQMLLRAFAPPVSRPEPLRWLAVLDPAAQRGLGIAFLDSAARSLVASRTETGAVRLTWS